MHDHGCCHAHASCCTPAVVPTDRVEPGPTMLGVKLGWSFDTLRAGRIAAPLLRPPRSAV
jgi:hypothetical protein